MKVKKVKIYIVVLVFLVCIMFLRILPITASNVQTIHGIIQTQIIEATLDGQPAKTNFFIQQCGGRKCDFQAARRAEQSGQIQNLPVSFVYLNGDFNFAEYAGKEVEIIGQNKASLNLSRKDETLDVNQSLSVSSIKVVDPSQINTTVLGPFTIPPPTHGSRKVLVELVNFQSAPSTPYTPTQIKDWVFTGQRSAKKYFEDVSFNQFTIQGVNDISGDVTPWLSLTASPTDCNQNIFNGWRTEADNLASAQGFSRVLYNIRIQLFPPIAGCNSTATASVGTFGDTNGEPMYLFSYLVAARSQI